MHWRRGRYSVEMLDEPSYSFASTDNVRAYHKELLLAGRHQVTSKHGLISFVDDERVTSIVVGTCGGATGVHDRSAILFDDRCFVAIGPELLCLTVPNLEVVWHHEADSATCFGLHISPTERAVVVHGELEISKWTFEGEQVWGFGGADIFTGALSIVGETVVVEDFEGRVYQIQLGSGRGVLSSA